MKKERRSKNEKSDAVAKSAAQEVPYILAAHGELHVASILERLRERGYSKIKYQSLSAELSTNTKNKRLYKRTAAATFALRAEVLRQINNEISEVKETKV